MKKYLLLLMLCIVVAASYAQSQPWNWSDKPGSVSITIGAPSAYTLIDSYNLSRAHRGMSYFGSYSINYDYNVLKWLAVGARGSYEGWQFYGPYNGMIGGGSASGENVLMNCHRASVLMNVRFTYINRENVQLYSGIGLGLSYLFRNENGDQYNYLGFAGSLIPIGIHVGAKNVYGLAELSLGTEALMSIGLGVKL